MAEKYYDVYVFDWGTSLKKVKRVLLLNRNYKYPRTKAGDDGITTVTYTIGEMIDHTTAAFQFNKSGLCGAVYKKKYPHDRGFEKFDLYLEQRKILTQRYGQPVSTEQDPKKQEAETIWDLERLKIDYVLTKDEEGESYSDIRYISKL